MYIIMWTANFSFTVEEYIAFSKNHMGETKDWEVSNFVRD